MTNLEWNYLLQNSWDLFLGKAAMILKVAIKISVLNVYCRALCVTLVFRLIDTQLCSFNFVRKKVRDIMEIHKVLQYILVM